MIKQTVSSNSPSSFDSSEPKSDLSVAQAQQIIFSFLLSIVNRWSPEDVLEAFTQLFISHSDSTDSEVVPALYAILFSNNQQEFKNTLKRSCYILVNNWEMARQFEAIQSLINIFQDPTLKRRTLSPTLKRLRQWVNNFAESSDFRELSLFTARFFEEKTINRPGEWVNQYSSYLLVSQYINVENPIEQREAARILSKRLKDKFKFELAMYTAHSQSSPSKQALTRNPTALGDGALRLIKAIVAKRGKYSYKNLARIFLDQTQDLNYENFKRNLPEYLFFTVKNYPITHDLKKQLQSRLILLYSEHNFERVDSSLVLRSCNRVIDYFMTEDRNQPSALFVMMLSQGNSLTLAIILLKLILISRGSLLYLEARIADLLAYYEQFPRDQCGWVINFLEIFRVTFAIYADNVEYNLIKVKNSPRPDNRFPEQVDWEAFRVYSQMLDSSDVNLEDI
ncbi:hypothetical protein H6G13_12925 [Pseudanabaena sp. FACHB-2040]|nr:hypothetical protein [Pseudanabaena sp. FACHB-2040]